MIPVSPAEDLTEPARTAPGWDRGVRRRWLGMSSLWILVLVAAVVATAVTVVARQDPPRPSPPPDEPAVVLTDAMQRRTQQELAVFTDWLAANDVEGYVGEIGIPDDGDERWLRLAEQWFDAADAAGLWVTTWSVGEWWGDDYIYTPFHSGPDGGPVDQVRPPGELLSVRATLTDLPRGVNVSGAEFGAAGGPEQTSSFSNERPGRYGRAYIYDSQETFDFIAAQGMDLVRLPFRWERIQPRLGDPLDEAELARLRAAVDRADAAGLDVVLDVHNFGAYMLESGGQGRRTPIGSDEVTRADFADLWRRLSQAFADDPGVVAYDLMNEPVQLPEAPGRTSAQLWEAASQDAVTAIRSTGDSTMIMVPGYEWSHVYEWTEQHPRAWINDPADNIRYTAHHYWQRGYDSSYDTEVADAQANGY